METNPVELARSYVESGKITVSPTEAAKVLGCTPYSLNCSAKCGKLGIPYIFAGRNLRISAAGLLAFVKGEKRA